MAVAAIAAAVLVILGVSVVNLRSHVDDLERVLPVLGCSIGVITVPANAAQSIADRLVACGISALLNFAPATLKLPHSVALRAIDLASELSILTSQLG